MTIGQRPRNESLRAERDHFVQIAEASPGVIHTFRMAPDGTQSFPYASPRIVDIYGMSAEELVANPAAALDLIHPDDRQRLAAAVDESARTMNPWHCEFRVHHPDKGEIWVEGWSAPE